MKSDSVIIVPTYNEKENIEKMIRALMALEHSFDVLVVDDGSPDGTAAIVKSLQQELAGRVHLIEREGKLGLGTAYIAGFKCHKGTYHLLNVLLFVVCRNNYYTIAFHNGPFARAPHKGTQSHLCDKDNANPKKFQIKPYNII